MNTGIKHLVTAVIFTLLLTGTRLSAEKAVFAGSGVLEATEVTVAPLITGKILSCTTEEGEEIKKDELLTEIDVENLKLQKAQLEAGFEEIEANRKAALAGIEQAKNNNENLSLKFNRIKELFSKGSATQQQLDDITTQYQISSDQKNVAEAQIPLLDSKKNQLAASIAVLDNQISYGKITSPLEGTVLEKYREAGEIAPLGSPLYKIANLKKMWLKIYLAETDMGMIALGRKVRVRMDALKDSLPGTISWVSKEAEFTPKNIQTKKTRAELVYAVKVLLDESHPELKIGMPAEVYLD